MRTTLDISGPWDKPRAPTNVSKRRKRPSQKQKEVKEEQVPLEMLPVVRAVQVYARTMRLCGSVDVLSVVSQIVEMVKTINPENADPATVNRIVEFANQKSQEILCGLAKVYDEE